MSREAEAVADAYRERIGHELHDYYIYVKKQSNYAGRLIKLLGIVQAGEVRGWRARYFARAQRGI